MLVVIAQPITANCKRIYSRREHICFGISPFNSVFSEDYIRTLMEWGLTHFRSVHLFVPDEPVRYTLEAMGYSPEKAKWKADKQNRYLFNKIYRALERVGISHDKASNMILDWKRLSTDSIYLARFQEVAQLFDCDVEFRAACLEASRWVLQSKSTADPGAHEESQKNLILAVKYFLAEIPLFSDVGRIVGEENSLFSYHQCIPFLQNLYSGTLRYKASPQQGFLRISSSNSRDL